MASVLWRLNVIFIKSVVRRTHLNVTFYVSNQCFRWWGASYWRCRLSESCSIYLLHRPTRLMSEHLTPPHKKNLVMYAFSFVTTFTSATVQCSIREWLFHGIRRYAKMAVVDMKYSLPVDYRCHPESHRVRLGVISSYQYNIEFKYYVRRQRLHSDFDDAEIYLMWLT